MARRRRTSLIEDLIKIASHLPWWVSLLIALGCWLILHPIATSQPEVPKGLHQMGQAVAGQLGRTLALFGQYLLPAAFVIGAIGSLLSRAKRKKLASDVANATKSGKTVEGISWREFEQLVGEVYRQKGFTVTEAGGSGPDGGVDLVLHMGTDKYLVQCKQWRAIKVGVTVIREFFGVMVAQGAAGGFVVTSGAYTQEAKDFAQGRNIQLVDGILLKRWISSRKDSMQSLVAKASEATSFDQEIAPICPMCSAAMTRKTAKRGVSIGTEFWGCPRFPACRGTRKII
ncbi:restriction endonuclease [Pseudomonas sp. YH-1]|uniref:restriction endonuclease n=1 Tax=Pseudomonas sp. YH-1 TaxID=3384787 RepID=UPI003F80CB34